jgi:hypothetical protein
MSEFGDGGRSRAAWGNRTPSRLNGCIQKPRTGIADRSAGTKDRTFDGESATDAVGSVGDARHETGCGHFVSVEAVGIPAVRWCSCR